MSMRAASPSGFGPPGSSGNRTPTRPPQEPRWRLYKRGGSANSEASEGPRGRRMYREMDRVPSQRDSPLQKIRKHSLTADNLVRASGSTSRRRLGPRSRSGSSSGSVRSLNSESSYASFKSSGLSNDQARSRSYAHACHRRKMREMSPTMRVVPPIRPLHMVNRTRRRFDEREQRAKIARENAIHRTNVEKIQRKPGAFSTEALGLQRTPSKPRTSRSGGSISSTSSSRLLKPSVRSQRPAPRHNKTFNGEFSTILPSIEGQYKIQLPKQPRLLPRKPRYSLTSPHVTNRVYHTSHPTLDAKRRRMRNAKPALLPDFESVTALYARIAKTNDDASSVVTTFTAASATAGVKTTGAPVTTKPPHQPSCVE